MENQNETVKRGKIAQRNGQTMLCPKCRKPMVFSYHRDVEVDFCKKCQGVWVDHIDEKQLLNIKPEVFSIDELRRLRKLYKPLGRVNSSGYVPCPICQVLMNRRNWGSHSGVIVDKCAEHGTWYDDGELEKVKEYIALGGIEYEKFRLTERGLSELDLKLMKKVHRLDKKIDSAYARALRNAQHSIGQVLGIALRFRRARFYSIIGF